MAFNFFRRQLNERERAVADRLPPGQYLTEKWPVLHYGNVPRVDLATWTFSMNGLVKTPVRLSHEEFMKLPRRTVTADIHCVTRWSMLDSTWEGVPVSEVMKLVELEPEATHVMAHAEQGFTANLSLDDFLRDENMLVDTRNGQPIPAEHGWPLRLFVRSAVSDQHLESYGSTVMLQQRRAGRHGPEPRQPPEPLTADG
jgi:DMSO/TMAO reductase YedYZ molybdopterin-dependent catalytic subunit